MKNKIGVIYKVTNNINGKSYIGQTTNFTSRKASHKRLDGNAKLLKQAIIKYGFENFKWEIIDENIDECLLDEREIYYIDKYNTHASNNHGYNLTHGGSRVFGASGEHHYLNQMGNDKKEWLKKYRIGENNPNFGNGQVTSGDNHYLNKMGDNVKERWLDENLRGEHNYQSKMTKEELKEKCWINHLDKEEKEKWVKKISGDNSPFHKAYLKDPDKYRGKNSSNFGKLGEKSPNAKKYIITFPNGDEYLTLSIKEFCRTCISHKLNSPGLYQCANNKIDSYKGFKCRHYTDNDANIQKWNRKG